MAWISQVIDVGSGKGYLSSFLSMQHGLRVFGIDSSSVNTHGAQERNRKLKKFSKVYQKHRKATKADEEGPQIKSADDGNEPREAELQTPDPNPIEEIFSSAMSLEVVQSGRVSLTDEERQRRKRENLQKKAQIRSGATGADFSPLTSYVTAETELRELIEELEVS